MFKKKINLLWFFIMTTTHTLWASDQLIGADSIEYFKRLSIETHKPIVLHIKVRDAFGDRETLEDEKEFEAADFPSIVTQSFLIEISDFLKARLPSLEEEGKTEGFEIEAVLQVNAPGHKEKVKGARGLNVIK